MKFNHKVKINKLYFRTYRVQKF